MKGIYLLLLFTSTLCFGQKTKQDYLDLIKTTRDTDLVKNYSRLSQFYHAEDNIDSALYCTKEAIKLAESLNYETGICFAYNHLATIEGETNYELSLSHFLKSLRIAEKIAKEQKTMPRVLKSIIPNTYLNIATTYMGMNDYKTALSYLYTSKAEYIKTSDSTSLAICYANIANCKAFIKDFDSCDFYVTEGIKIGTQVLAGNPLREIIRLNTKHSLNSLQQTKGIILNEKGKFKEAAVLLDSVWRDVAEDESSEFKAELLNELATSYNGLKMYDSSISILNKSLEIIKNDSLPETVLRASELLYEAYKNKGNYSKALENYTRFKDISESLAGKEKMKAFAEIKEKYETEKKEETIRQLAKEKKNQYITIALISVLALIATGLFLFAYRSARLQKKIYSQKEEIIVKQKEIETAALQRKMTELEQMALRAQMNPHFIFNSLNSVQHFVINQDTEGVNKYLGAFAHLVRLTFENSFKQLIPLEEEINYLETYLSLEQMKAMNSFTYSITCAPGINTGETYIPGMTIQPFVENCIKHGIANIGNGKITIAFSHNGNLLCTVTDNGIGRKKAGATNITAAGYKPKGIAVTMNRIEVINQLYNAAISVETDDITGETGLAAGTVVKISFPDDLGK